MLAQEVYTPQLMVSILLSISVFKLALLTQAALIGSRHLPLAVGNQYHPIEPVNTFLLLRDLLRQMVFLAQDIYLSRPMV